VARRQLPQLSSMRTWTTPRRRALPCDLVCCQSSATASRVYTKWLPRALGQRAPQLPPHRARPGGARAHHTQGDLQGAQHVARWGAARRLGTQACLCDDGHRPHLLQVVLIH
jgi:hypothetical protein